MNVYFRTKWALNFVYGCVFCVFCVWLIMHMTAFYNNWVDVCGEIIFPMGGFWLKIFLPYQTNAICAAVIIIAELNNSNK